MSLAIGIIGSALVLLLLTRFRLSFFLAVGVQIALMLIGLAVIADRGEGSWRTFILSGAALLVFILGHWLGSLRRRSKSFGTSSQALPVSDTAVWLVTCAAGTLGMYHLLVSGIPLFSSSIETQRFDFTSSGFYGIPGRMYLYGITISWVLASVNASNQGKRWRDSGPWRLATFFFLLSACLSGFKGELLAQAIVMVGVFVIVTGRRIQMGSFLMRHSWVAAIPVAYFFAIAALYPTYGNSDVPLWVQMADRATVVGAQPGQYAIEGRTVIHVDNVIINDLRYFSMKYSGQNVDGMFTLDRLVSSSILGIDPSSSDWAPPVTVGAFAELVYGYGDLVAYIAYLLLGFLMAMWDSSSSRANSIRQSARIVGVLAISNLIIKGGIAYTIVNYFAVSACLLCIVLGAEALTVWRTGRQRTSVLVPNGARTLSVRRGQGPHK